MPTRDEVFEELGLMPVYVRKNLTEKPLPVGGRGRGEGDASSKIRGDKQGSANVSNSMESPMESSPTAAFHHPTAATAGEARNVPLLNDTEESMPSQKIDNARAQRIANLNWDELNADIAQCTACKLCKTRTNTVPGFGARGAANQWMIVGEAPGADEDAQGEPFVGRSGKLLDAMLKSVDRSRERNVFIANTLKCRPPDNRNPEPDELAACDPYIKRQIALVQPKMIFAVGKFAAQTVTGSDEAIGAMRGKTYSFHDTPVRVTYHPAYLLRSPLEKAKAWDDLLAAKQQFS
jgi:uracil-DNA glycosylase